MGNGADNLGGLVWWSLETIVHGLKVQYGTTIPKSGVHTITCMLPLHAIFVWKTLIKK